jgi:D-3-phosphoglycerate dehydrogenase
MCEVVICDLDHKDINEEMNVFSREGLDLLWLHCKTQEEVIERCLGARVLLNQYVRMDRKIFEALPSVKCVIRYGVGYDNVSLEDAAAYGVQICNIPDYGTREVADQALAHMMSLVKKITLTNGLIRKGIWDYQKSIPIFRISDAVVGICGVGRIGSAFAERVRPLCREIIAYDAEYECDGRSFPDYIKFVTFDELLEKSDILSVHCPRSDDTYHMFDKNAFAAMKNTAYFINVSRGGIVDENALFSALENGEIAGAGLDVVENEPLDRDNPLLELNNFSISPHSAWYSEQSAKELKRKAAEEAVRFINNTPLKYALINL